MTLFIPNKEQAGTNQKPRNDDLVISLRAIERWANSQSSGGYASLTGPGQTTTPGALTQAGPFIVYGGLTNTGAPNPGYGVDIEAGIQVSGGSGTTGGPGGIALDDWGAPGNNGIRINSNSNNVYLSGSSTHGVFSLTLGGTSSPAPGGTSGFTASGNGGVLIQDESTVGININEYGSSGNISFGNSGSGSINFTSAGDFLVQTNDTVQLNAGGPSATLASFQPTSITLDCTVTGGQILMNADNDISLGASVIALSTSVGQLTISGLPTTNPGVANRVWRNGNVLNIV